MASKPVAVGPKSSTKPKISVAERILVEASELFARQGYHATTTRQIAQAVGVRQPSLFHHIESKASLMSALLRYATEWPHELVVYLASLPGPAAPRLYRFLYEDSTHMVHSRYNLFGVISPGVMEAPEFADWSKSVNELHDWVRSIIVRGMTSGEFLEIDAELGRAMVMGTNVSMMRRSWVRLERFTPDTVPSFALRALLSEPSTLDAVKVAAHAIELPEKIELLKYANL